MEMMTAALMMQTGGPEVLETGRIAIPELPSPSHIRVRLRAAGINPIDTKLRKNGTYFPGKFPVILGCDGAGEVEAVGSAVTRFNAGDEVYFFNGGIGSEPGNYAQYTTIHQDYAAHKPKQLSMAEAAALPLVLITAWEALFDRTGTKAGDTVLIHAAAGGVGHIAVQLAHHAGARVAATVSNEEKAAFVGSLGAEHIIRYTERDFVDAVLQWTNQQGVDVVFDTVGGETFCKSFAAGRVYGKIVTLLQTACEVDAIKTARLRNQSIVYELMLTPLVLGMHEARCAQRRILEEGAKLAEAGKLKITVNQIVPLDQAAEAHKLIESGHTVGKIVLQIA
jgi:NADPH2:quinone reductase